MGRLGRAPRTCSPISPITLNPPFVKLSRSCSSGTRAPGWSPWLKPVPGMTRFGAASIHFCTLFGSPNTTAVTLSRSISATTSFTYSPLADGYSLGVHSSCTQPNGASAPFGSDAVNADVFGHIGPSPGNDSSIAWW